MLTQNRGGRNYNDNSSKCEQSSRREFLKKLGVLPVAAMAAEKVVSSARAGEARLPRIKFGKVSLSRLVCGTNPFNAGSHLSVFVNHEMRQYYTPEQILKTLRRCQEVDINCWQAGKKIMSCIGALLTRGARCTICPSTPIPKILKK
ncbi:MAG: hypothetical protein ACYS6W_15060 [Planctomycetota bacterium]|jgi:hypothetical protein